MPSETHLMKWLFLMRMESPAVRASAFYDFLPYRYGPYSFQAAREIDGLVAGRFMEKGGIDVPPSRYEAVQAETRDLRLPLRRAVSEVLERYGGLSRQKLIDTVYGMYPWFASRSELREPADSPSAPSAVVYTVGYEGRSIDAFLDHLLRSGIERLVDVRKNAYSRKYGFTGSTLSRLCGHVGIEYVHVPALGVPRELRLDLSTPGALEKLFAYYDGTVLPSQSVSLDRVARLISEGPSALLCFEADPAHCHRGRIAARLGTDTHMPVQHL